MNHTIRGKSMMTAGTVAVLLAVILLFPSRSPGAGEEVSSAIRRYKEYEVSTGYYEDYEVLPRHRRPFVGNPGVTREIFPHAQTASAVRSRTHLSDSHINVRHYEKLRCETCHVEEAKNLHTVRGNLTCRQCHGGEPIASIDHYFSPMNPIRRHAYICAKCHEGSSVSFATYVIHPPNPATIHAQKTFPVLFYVFWFMIAIAVGTFVVFLPHAITWGIRELLPKKKKGESV